MMTSAKKNVTNPFWDSVQDFTGNPLRIMLLMGTDFLWSFFVLLCTYFIYHYINPVTSACLNIFRDSGIIAFIIVTINSLAKCYHGSILNPGAAINRIEEIRRTALSVLGTYFIVFSFLYLDGEAKSYSILIIISSLAITIIGFPMIRFLARYCMKKIGIGQIRVFIAGAGKNAQLVGTELEMSAYYGYKVLGYFDDDVSKKNISINGKQYLGRICDAARLAKFYNVHYIICCLPPLVLPKIMHTYTHVFKHVLVIPSSDILPITAIYPTLIGFISGFEFQNRILFPFPRFLKRLFEIIVSAFSILLLLPVFLILAILVKISGPGPVFYTAKRLGLSGKEIKVFKFRTMKQNAEEKLESLLEENPDMKAEWEKNFKLKNDPRITKIGSFLRKTSLDELPQFINVLRGEMSIIGPRPIVPAEIKYYGEAYDFFKRVRPGITGLWQVSGRSSLDYQQRVSMDMFYVMNWSLWLDWFIFCKTFFVVLRCKGSC